MQVDMTTIIMGIVTILVGIAEVYLIPWLKAKIGNERLATLVDTIDILVQAAEQIAERDGYNGEWKKARVRSMLIAKGVIVDESIDDYIEAAVYNLKSQIIEIE